MVPAAAFKVLVNGVSAKGSFDAGPKEGGLQMPPVFVILSTVWSQPNQQAAAKEEEQKEEGSTSNRFR